jgi:hypothetical protein
MPVFLFVLPGILLILSRSFNKKGLSELVVYFIGASLSFFVVFPWIIKPLGYSLLGSAYAVFILSIFIAAFGYKSIAKIFLNIDKSEVIILLLLLMVLALRSVPFFVQQTAAGADMSMHSYIAKLVYDNDGIPNSYEPLLPIPHFGAYPTGFPTLSAMVSLLGGVPVHRSALLLACFTHAFLCFGLYAFLLRFFDRNTAAAASIAATFLTRSPQWVMRWGGNPTVLALFFFIIAFSLVVELKEGFSLPKVFFAALALAATLITHSIVFYVGGIVLAIYFLLSLLDYKDIYKTAFFVLLLMLAFLLPYLAELRFTLTRSAIESTRAWQLIDVRSVVYDLAAGIPLLSVSVFGLFVLIKKNLRVAVVFWVVTAGLAALIMNYRFWFMPFSYLLYPGRVALFFVIPLAVFISPALSDILSAGKKPLLFGSIILGLVFYSAFYLYNSFSMCSVTRADMDAFRWMDNMVSKTAVIQNNYGDAGLWIPAIIGRTITHPHSEPVNSEELAAGLSKLKAGYVYIGSKAVYDISYRKEDLEKDPSRYRLIYNDDGAQVWKIL